MTRHVAPLVLVICLAGLPVVFTLCTTDLDCQLNGVCSDFQCQCRSMWEGENCEFVSFSGEATVAYHPPEAGWTSWGGQTWMDNSTSPPTYHMWVSEVIDGCTIAAWETNSRIAHATSTNPLGPFKRTDVVTATCFSNTQFTMAPDGTFLLIFIGSSDVPKPVNCSAGEVPVTSSRVGESDQDGTVNIMSASSPDGPWTMHSNVLAGLNGSSVNDWNAHVTNPTLVFDPKTGEPRMYFRANPRDNHGTPYLPHVGGATAAHWAGPYKLMSDEPLVGGGNDWNEDPYVWADEGGYHMLTHHCKDDPGVGGHAFSPDGLVWTAAPTSAYNLTVVGQPADGLFNIFRRERPTMLFDASGKPQVLYNSAAVHSPPTGLPRGYSYTLAAQLN